MVALDAHPKKNNGKAHLLCFVGTCTVKHDNCFIIYIAVPDPVVTPCGESHSEKNQV